MKKIASGFIAAGILILCSCAGKQAGTWSLSGPEGNVRFTLILADSGLSYRVDAAAGQDQLESVLEPSPLGITRSDQDFRTGLLFVSKSETRMIDETYRMLIGKRSQIRNRCVEQAFTFQNKGKARMQIVARAYQDGVAFRYVFPEVSTEKQSVIAEATGFDLPSGGKAWMLPYMKVDTWAPSYEAEWMNGIETGTSAPDTVGWSLPALFQTGGLWVMLAEAAVDSHYFGAHLEQAADGGLYRIRLPEYDETYGVAPREASSTLPWIMPWRVIITGRCPAVILESDMVCNLSPSCAIADTSWIRPGRVSWSWWSDPGSPFRYDRLVPFIDLAAELGWEYSLIDLGWHEMTGGGDIRKLIDYSRSKGIGLILWYNSGGPHNQVPNACPCDIMHDPVRRKSEMAKLESWGIKGIKVDFMQSEKQHIMKLYQDILIDAAAHHLVVDFHGCTIPRGWSRTYPNLLTMEAVRGAEQYWDVHFAEKAHMFHTIYTFTRNVVGPMDYTPVIFGDAPNKNHHQTTNAHELATAVVFESGLQHFADDARSYLSQPHEVLDFLSTVPVAWDETRYIAGEPGVLSVLARRKGRDWYVAGLNGETAGKTVSVPLSFLESGPYECLLLSDGKDARSFDSSTITVTKQDVLSVKMEGRGGFAARIRFHA